MPNMAAAVHICGSCARQRQRQSRRSAIDVASCAAASNGNRSRNANFHIYSTWALLSLLAASAAMVQSAAMSFGDLLSRPLFKPLCSFQHEHFIESDGQESSLIIELKPGVYGAQHPSCARILSAPDKYGFIVRLILPKLRHQQSFDDTSSSSSSSSTSTERPEELPTASMPIAVSGMSTLIERLNVSSSALKTIVGRTCPLNIFSSLDPHTPQWRVDPCQLEDTAPEMEDPVRLFDGRVRIVWEHGHHALKSKLMVTVLGKGEECKDSNKHQCLRIGNEPMLCISKELSCDGIRHCPYSNEYDSDENYELCHKQRRHGPLPTALESDLLEQLALLEVFRNLFAYDAPTSPDTLPGNNSSASGAESAASNTTTLRKVHSKDMKKPSADGNGSLNAIDEPEEQQPAKTDNATADSGSAIGSGSGFTRRNSTRTGVHSDLSKYGPWGYLMLGMLLCGGALLICGLWASASQHAVNNEREAALAAANAAGLDQSNITSPPNYEELDPPPAYSVLFPNQKAASSNTLTALDSSSAATTTAAAAAAAAVAAAATAAATPTVARA